MDEADFKEVDSTVLEMENKEEEEDTKELQFHEMELDDRILKAIAKLGWQKPTPIQEKAIPLGLDGKDILSRARTGSGKTAAYIIPIVQRLLQMKQNNDEYDQQTCALVLVPSRELSSQANKMIEELTSYCSRQIKCLDLSTHNDVSTLKPQLCSKPDIIVGTPARVLAHVREGTISSIKQTLSFLVIDEADLLFSFGYKEDIQKLIPHLSTTRQSFLLSATLSEDVDELKSLLLNDPISLNLEESRLALGDQLTQYHVTSETEEEKFLLMYALMKLKLIRGKTIMFVNSIHKCYRLKLFLEQFSIFPTVLNSELPLNSRCHVVEQFNQGLYEFIIATDESYLLASQETKKDKKDAKDTKGKKGKKMANHKKKKLAATKEYGVSRGIDFDNVKNVINFDFPPTVDSYIHRVGRTARGDKTGTALSLVLPEEGDLLEETQQQLGAGGDNLNEEEREEALKPYQFKMDEIDGLRYRCKDALRSVTKSSIRDARLKELRSEILNSDKLKTYFEDNPHDLKVLRHDTVLRPKKIQRHMKNMPEYLIPNSLKQMYSGQSNVNQQNQHAAPPSHDVKLKKSKRAIKTSLKRKKQMLDPLQNMSKQAKM